ncbi:DNA polymerase III subunit alpha [Actinomyces sp. zg-332]|uniref:DNA polymerase III subunit alpha n=1 Tax=Actinomyces sp. zg-332 TaxID=2708340 RepID=UPI0014247A93|nr:DNA polymerase III subunit alpha [Actinomyces sp. zg-332]QPK94436.1 DNA polymerase III subunit alpha [Actinomyces sp. zg-332]
MASNNFTHLHVHTDYSMLDGAAKISALVSEVDRLGQKAVAITDHGYVFGAYELYSECKKRDIKPIIGIEAYLTPGTSRFDTERQLWGSPEQQKAGDDVSARGAYTHMTLLARNNEGMHNLFRLASYASLEGQFGKWPRMDRELLQTYSKGLIGSTGCPSGEIQTRIRLGQFDKALEVAGELQDMFGKDYFYVEVMNHGIDIEKRVIPSLIDLSQKINAPLIATNDSHYVKKEDYSFQDALLCINSGSILSDPNRFKFDGIDYYLKPAEEMRHIWRDFPEACDNTLLVAEQCNVSFYTADEGANFMPRFPVPPGEDEHSWFVKEVEKGLHARFPNGISEQVRRQTDYEVSVITKMGFPGYFLVVADFINWAKSKGIRVGPGRGSGAGSMVAYALRITELNPLQHGLIFERFLNPERVSMPDFDVDFDERRRGEVIEYVTNKYGDDRVAQVITYGKIKAKQALKDSARVLGYPYIMGEKLTKAMPPAVMGKDIPVSEIYNSEHKRYKEAEEFRKLVDNDQDAKKIFDLSKGIEGLTRQWGVHACAVIMSSKPLVDIIPLMKRLQDGAIITQFDYPTCEKLGLLKMDFLGLRNLTVISDALENIVHNNKDTVDLDNISLHDDKTFNLLSQGDTLGVFQLEGAGMRSLLRLMRPDNFEDISAVGALYRPGPMGADSHTNYALRKNGLQKITPIHPELEEPLKDILGGTYGLIVYQEQVMAIAQKLAGYSLGQADLLRRAMGKKKKAELDKQYSTFLQGMLDRGYSEAAVTTLWEILLPFSDYAFNKAHSAAYALVSYWTAYLKANYPVEYMAALLTSQKDNKDKLATYLGECRRMGITVLPPDVNYSQASFTPVGEDIRFGLGAIRNVGEGIVKDIIATREAEEGFTSFEDFLSKCPGSACSKRSVESLIKAGAFDSLGYTRRALYAIFEEAVDAALVLKKNEAVGQFDLFAAFDVSDSSLGLSIPDIPEWSKKEKLDYERHMLGLYVSDHPLNGLEPLLNANRDVSLIDFLEDSDKYRDNMIVKVCGLVTSMQKKTTKQGNLWTIVTLEDLVASINVLFFPQTYQTVSTILEENILISVTGRLKKNEDDSFSIYATEMTLLDANTQISDLPFYVNVSESLCTQENILALKETLSHYPGDTPVKLRVRTQDNEVILALGKEYSVNSSSSLIADLKQIFGYSCIQI